MHFLFEVSDCKAFLFVDQNNCFHTALAENSAFCFLYGIADSFMRYGYFELLRGQSPFLVVSVFLEVVDNHCTACCFHYTNFDGFLLAVYPCN